MNQKRYVYPLGVKIHDSVNDVLRSIRDLTKQNQEYQKNDWQHFAIDSGLLKNKISNDGLTVKTFDIDDLSDSSAHKGKPKIKKLSRAYEEHERVPLIAVYKPTPNEVLDGEVKGIIPNISIPLVGEKYLILDGFHRTQALRELGRKKVEGIQVTREVAEKMGRA